MDKNMSPSRFETLNLHEKMVRSQVERKIATLLEKPVTYSPYGSNLEGGTIEYVDGEWILEITYTPGIPAAWVKRERGAVEHYPLQEETIASFEIKNVKKINDSK